MLQSVNEIVEQHRLTWYGDIQQMSNERWPWRRLLGTGIYRRWTKKTELTWD